MDDQVEDHLLHVVVLVAELIVEEEGLTGLDRNFDRNSITSEVKVECN